MDKKVYAKNIYWVYGLVLKKNSNISLDTFMKKLKKEGIETRNFFWPLHQQPILKKMGFFNSIDSQWFQMIERQCTDLYSELFTNDRTEWTKRYG